MKFRVQIRQISTGRTWWEDFQREPGQANRTSWGTQPEFTGDIAAWGKSLIDWFNKTAEDVASHREFIQAELVSDKKTSICDMCAKPVDPDKVYQCEHCSMCMCEVCEGNHLCDGE